MEIDPRDREHPKNYACSWCGAQPGEWCTSEEGAIYRNKDNQHSARWAKVGEWIHGS